MRTWLVAILLVPLSQAWVVDDPAGDQELWIETTSQPVPDGFFEAGDLLALTIEEDQQQFTFHLAVVELDHGDDVPLLETMQTAIAFRHGEVRYALHMQWNLHLMVAAGDEPTAFCDLWTLHDQFPERIERIECEADVDAARITAWVPRDQVPDQDAAFPVPGHVFEEIQVVSRADGVELPTQFANGLLVLAGQQVSLVRVNDFLPDDGTATYEVQQGGGVVSGLSLSSPEPARASNGEATTLLFEADLLSLVDRPVETRFKAADVPDGWDIWFPTQGTELAAGQGTTVPVLVSMPFVHEHGSRQEFTVRVEAADDASTHAELVLAVAFTEVPQPSGHHPRVWAHGGTAGQIRIDDISLLERPYTFWNTLEEADQEPIPARFVPAKDGYASGWSGPLLPGLGMGLQVDLARVGEAVLDITTTRPIADAQIGGRVVHVVGEQETVLMELVPRGDPMAFGPMSTETFEADLVPTGVARVPYHPDGQLWFEAWLEPITDGNDPQPLLDEYAEALTLEQAWMDLPLLEYHDAVDEAYASIQQVRLSAVQEALVNPGRTTVFDVTLFNNGPEDAAYVLSLEGEGMLSTERLEVARGGSQTFQVGLRAPESASHGDGINVVVQAVHADDADVRALLRLVARVDDRTEVPDQADTFTVKPPTEDAPGANALLAVLAASMACGVLRRRHSP